MKSCVLMEKKTKKNKIEKLFDPIKKYKVKVKLRIIIKNKGKSGSE